MILAEGDAPLRTSARNQLAGTVIAHLPGVVSDEVKLALDGDAVLTATITHESGETLGFAPGARARALIKASHVILAVE